jgi:formate hydrogenlyase transcriptional activator
VIAATNKNLSELVAEQAFRIDLFYRLNVFPITLPRLRDRREDIPNLVRHFVRNAAASMQRPIRTIPCEAMQTLMDHHWPGNVRELQNIIERAVILAEDGVLRVPRLDPKRDVESSHSGGSTLNQMERGYILEVLDKTSWIIGGKNGAAWRLGLPRTTLISKMKKLGIPPHSARLSGRTELLYLFHKVRQRFSAHLRITCPGNDGSLADAKLMRDFLLSRPETTSRMTGAHEGTRKNTPGVSGFPRSGVFLRSFFNACRIAFTNSSSLTGFVGNERRGLQA